MQLRASRLCQNKTKKQLNQDDYYELSVVVNVHCALINYYVMGTAIQNNDKIQIQIVHLAIQEKEE